MTGRPSAALSEKFTRVLSALTLRERAPLDYWHHSSAVTRKATELLGLAEVYLRAGSMGGKTEWGAAATLAMMQRRPELDGVPLPQIMDRRALGVVLALDYPQQQLSVQPTYLRLLGAWPHRPRYKRDGILSSLLIRPVGGSDDTATWSELRFLSQANLKSGTGARGVHVAHADEPPVEPIWREMRKAAHAGRKIVRIITATPLVRRQWWWLKQEYEAKNEGQIYHGRIELRLRSFYKDEAGGRHSDNLALGPADLEALEWNFEKDLLREARWAGEYIDVESDKPFDGIALMEMAEAWGREPECHDWSVTREAHDDTGLVRIEQRVTVEVYAPPEAVKEAYIAIDPSRGGSNTRLDPGGIVVCEMGTGNLLARYEGYIGSFGLGILGAGLARQYHNAVVDFESNGGWGEGVMRGLAEAGYGNVARTQKMLQPKDGGRVTWETRYGWETTRVTRPAMISAIQAWIAAFKAGVPYAICPSRRILEQLMDVLLDDNDKPVAAPGLHDEFMILWGQQLRKTQRVRVDHNLARQFVRAPRRDVLAPPPEPTLAEIMARHDRRGGPRGGTRGPGAGTIPALRPPPRT